MKRPIWVCALLTLLALGIAPVGAMEPPAASSAVRFEGLGSHTRKLGTASADAQAFFDQGLAFMYAFNHDEAIRSFSAAATFDPSLAMAWWGVAIANGPHINNAVLPPQRNAAALVALDRARALLDSASPVERALIEALSTRYSSDAGRTRADLDRAYAEAMSAVWRDNPRDTDVGALYAEALAELRPWDLWTASGEPQPGTEDLIATLDAVLALDARHPLANHLYVHALEASPEPGRADRAADMLRELQPSLGHMVHMPSHIDVRRGRWQASVRSNLAAIEADRLYLARAPAPDFYRLYMSHNHHMLAYSAMMTGQSALAIRTMRALVAEIPEQFFRDNAFADGFMAMPLEVLMRFGHWEEILAEAPYPEYAPFSRALRHYARAVALAATGKVEQAREEQRAFATARAAVPADHPFGNNTAPALLDIADHVMRGEIEYRSGDVDGGIELLARGAALEDQLRYDEPPGWIQPVRHPWGAALLKAGRAAKAEAVFRDDLARQPGNGWGLYGLMRALQMQGKKEEAASTELLFDAAWAKADIKIKSPCLCLPGV